MRLVRHRRHVAIGGKGVRSAGFHAQPPRSRGALFSGAGLHSRQPLSGRISEPGYGLAHTDYSFLAEVLSRTGYLVVAIQHVLPTDPPLATRGEPFDARVPMWKQGADTLRFVREALQPRYPG